MRARLSNAALALVAAVLGALFVSVGPVGAVAPLPTGAPAASGAPRTCAPATLSILVSYLGQALNDRSGQLQSLSSTVANDATLSAADRSALSSLVAKEQSGIASLAQQAPGLADCASAIAARRSMVSDYRVYLVMTPQVHLVLSADNELSIASRLSALEPGLEAAITASADKGNDVSAPSRSLSDLERQVAAVTQAVPGVSVQVLGVTPASYPGSSATFRSDVITLRKSRNALVRADADLHALVSELG